MPSWVFLLCFIVYFATVNMAKTSWWADLQSLSLWYRAKPSSRGNSRLLHQLYWEMTLKYLPDLLKWERNLFLLWGTAFLLLLIQTWQPEIGQMKREECQGVFCLNILLCVVIFDLACPFKVFPIFYSCQCFHKAQLSKTATGNFPHYVFFFSYRCPLKLHSH